MEIPPPKYFVGAGDHLVRRYQTLLWLPCRLGEQTAFCAHNRIRGILEAPSDGEVISEPAVETDFYYPVPVNHTLSPHELSALANLVVKLMDDPSVTQHEPLIMLCNDYKCFVLAALAEMALLPGKQSREEA